jgi:UDP-N-acetylmuramyl pentapeptide phosphotransferase/UDP-N-acetylglucosamine-1-phosphate transferase
MNPSLFILICTIGIITLNFFLKKKNYLINETGDHHQKFASKNKIPLTGGIFIFISSLYFFKYYQNIFLFYFILILILGILSDLNIIKSAKKRIFFQFLIIISFVFFNEIEIVNTKIHILDNLLKNNSFELIFISFCILIVTNGSNFLDGLNTLNIGYHLAILMIIFNLDNLNVVEIYQFPISYFIIVLSIILILNVFDKIYLGDSGSYLIGFSTSVGLIYLYELNQNISPFFIVLLLWYPCYEILFSILRKNIMNKSPLHPDTMHLHQHIFFILKKKYKMKILTSNILSAILINSFNLLIFFLAATYASNSQIQILFIILNILLYSILYIKLHLIRYKKT